MSKAKGHSKKSLLLLVAVFVLPVIAAKLALDNDFFNRASTNKGELINPIIDTSALLQDADPKWRLVYAIPSHCDTRCENAIFSIHQVWQALGKESDRAEAVVLVSGNSDKKAVAQLGNQPYLNAVSVAENDLKNVFGTTHTDAIFVVDTLNNAMLKYPLMATQEEAIMHSRDILSDLKKMLKLSRIG